MASNGKQLVRLLLATQDQLWSCVQQEGVEWLSTQEIQRSSLLPPKRQQQFIACRLGLRKVLATPAHAIHSWRLTADYGHPPMVAELQPATEPDGETFQSYPPPYPFLSLSHSQNWVLCASAPQAVGVDVEVLPFQRARNVLAMAEMVCSRSELAHIFALQETNEKQTQFTKYWVLKESSFKRCGIGLDWQRIQRLSCIPASECSAAHNVLAHAWLWQLDLPASQQLICALCTQTFVARESIHVEPDSLHLPANAEHWCLVDAS